MMVRPKVSIVVPVYNVEAYLEKCMDSIINQTYANLEIVCINDGSTDNSLDILKSYALKDDRVLVITTKNNGISSARNTGTKHSTGKYIMYVDSDDWIELNTCEEAVNKAEEYDADVVFWNYIREFENCSKEKVLFEQDEIVYSSSEEIKALSRRFLGLYKEELSHPENADTFVTVWGKLYRTNIITDYNVEFVDLKLIGSLEDALFNLNVFNHIHKAIYVRKFYSHYRKDNNVSFTKTYRKNLNKQWNNLFAYMRSFIKDNHCDDSYNVALNNRICLSIIGLGLNVLESEKSLKKCSAIKQIIASNEYRNAVAKLELAYFPMHWKVFFFCAKYNFAMGVYLLLKCIKRIISS